MEEERWVQIIRENLAAKARVADEPMPYEEKIYVPGLFALSRSIAEKHDFLADYEEVRDESKPEGPDPEPCPTCGHVDDDGPKRSYTVAELALHGKLERLWAANPDLFGVK